MIRGALNKLYATGGTLSDGATRKIKVADAMATVETSNVTAGKPDNVPAQMSNNLRGEPVVAKAPKVSALEKLYASGKPSSETTHKIKVTNAATTVWTSHVVEDELEDVPVPMSNYMCGELAAAAIPSARVVGDGVVSFERAKGEDMVKTAVTVHNVFGTIRPEGVLESMAGVYEFIRDMWVLCSLLNTGQVKAVDKFFDLERGYEMYDMGEQYHYADRYGRLAFLIDAMNTDPLHGPACGRYGEGTAQYFCSVKLKVIIGPVKTHFYTCEDLMKVYDSVYDHVDLSDDGRSVLELPMFKT